jgi:periplasmic protein TonB
MAYQALLFCPEEKTARTVTQVLSELEFQVEPCIEPFAAVKKLMSQHFDAIVVDCDNEQNATLLFKSSRNSTSNQTSLAVAIVEGQAGVAKAFRIGANLVLTKPINVEQSKGTLRVARGLLRKGEPVKPGIPVAAPLPAPASAAPTPAKPLGPKPVPRPVPTPSPVSHSPAPKPPTSLPPRPVAAAKTVSAPHSEIASAKTFDSAPSSDSHFPETSNQAVAATPKTSPMVETGTPESITVTASASGAASAPARAREPELPSLTQAAPSAAPAKREKPIEKPLAGVGLETSTSAKAEPVPSFTFGGANVDEPAAGPSKKIFIGIAAVVLIAVGAYAGWTYLQGHKTQPNAIVTAPAPIVPKPQPSTPATIPAPPATSASPASPTETKPVADNTESATADNDETAAEKPSHPAPSAAKSATSAAQKAAPEKQTAPEKSAETPLLVSGGSAPVHHAPPASDASAPSVIGIAAPSSTGDLSAIASDSGAGAKPVLQAMKVSQGVSQGLIIKRVAPTYPHNALIMHIEGNVELMATISKDGDIKDIKVLSGDSQLSRAAVQAVKQWRYKPYLLSGEPVEIQTQITVEFKLPR